MTAYYNEHDCNAAAWLRELIKAGQIADGIVDERDIQDVTPKELAEFTQCHFFAGIGGWSAGLRRAGWPDSRPVWTGSCPCQPFSAAGKGAGFDDERHLWPAFYWLIQHGKPRDVPVLGEQVASADGLAWLDLVHANMEAAKHAFAAVDLCSAGFGGVDIRQRLYWLANAHVIGRQPFAHEKSANLFRKTDGAGKLGVEFSGTRAGFDMLGDPTVGRLANAARKRAGRNARIILAPHGRPDSGMFGIPESASQPFIMGDTEGNGRNQGWPESERQQGRFNSTEPSGSIGMADSESARLQGRRSAIGDGNGSNGQIAALRSDDGMEHAGSIGRERRQETESRNNDDGTAPGRPQSEYGAFISGAYRLQGDWASPLKGFWRDADWLFCKDGKWRPVEPGTFPLDTRILARMGRLRGYGNAINVEVAAGFIEAAKEYLDG